MGWFGDRLLAQKPRKSGCVTVLLAVVLVLVVLVGCGGPTSLQKGDQWSDGSDDG